MNKTELIAAAPRARPDKKDTERVINAAIDALPGLVKGDKVRSRLRHLRDQGAEAGWPQPTPGSIEIRYRVPAFKASKALKDVVAK